MDRWPFVIQYTLYVASTSLASVVLVVTGAFVWLLIDPTVANDPIYKIIGPAFQDIIISFISLVAAVGAYIAGRDAGRKETQETP